MSLGARHRVPIRDATAQWLNAPATDRPRNFNAMGLWFKCLRSAFFGGHQLGKLRALGLAVLVRVLRDIRRLWYPNHDCSLRAMTTDRKKSEKGITYLSGLVSYTVSVLELLSKTQDLIFSSPFRPPRHRSATARRCSRFQGELGRAFSEPRLCRMPLSPTSFAKNARLRSTGERDAVLVIRMPSVLGVRWIEDTVHIQGPGRFGAAAVC